METASTDSECANEDLEEDGEESDDEDEDDSDKEEEEENGSGNGSLAAEKIKQILMPNPENAILVRKQLRSFSSFVFSVSIHMSLFNSLSLSP